MLSLGGSLLLREAGLPGVLSGDAPICGKITGAGKV